MKKSSALVRGRPGGGALVDLKLVDNCMKQLTAHREAIGELNDDIRSMLGEKKGRLRSTIAKTLQKVLPNRVMEILPGGMTKFIADETEMLERIETLLRENTNGTQKALVTLIQSSKATQEEMAELANDIRTAIKEGWNAQRLQEYIADKSGIEIFAQVSELLDAEFKVLTDEERELRKNELLAQLEATLKTGDALMVMMGKACDAGLQVFQTSMSQYYSYLRAYKPMIALRDTAQQLMQTNAAMFIAKGALDHTFATALDAIAISLDVAKQAHRFSISSPVTVKMLEDGQAMIEQKLADLDKARAENVKRLRGQILESPSLIEARGEDEPIDVGVVRAGGDTPAISAA